MAIIGIYLPYDDNTLCQTELYIEMLDQVQHLIETVGNSKPLFVLGDLNISLPNMDFITERWHFRKPYSKHSALMYEFISGNDMCVADMLNEQLVSYTFRHGNKSSFIDHILIPNYLADSLKRCIILCDDGSNTSDHQPVSMKVMLPMPSQSVKSNTSNVIKSYPRPRWQDPEFIIRYMDSVKASLNEIPVVKLSDIPGHHIKAYVNSLCDSIVKEFIVL